MGLKPCLIAAVLGLALVPVGESTLQTTTPTVYIAIHITLSSSKVVLEPRSVPRGAAGRFIMTNTSTKPIIFSVGAQTPGLNVRFGFRAVVGPRTQQTRILYLATRGLVPYYEGRSFASAMPGAKGMLIVGPTCARCAGPGPSPIP